MKTFPNILGATKFEVHFHIFSEVFTGAVYGGTLYLGIIRKSYKIFYGLILLLQGLFYSLLKLFALKRNCFEPIITMNITKRRKFIDYFGISNRADPSRVGKKNIYIFHIGYILSPSSVKLHISRHHLGIDFNL